MCNYACLVECAVDVFSFLVQIPYWTPSGRASSTEFEARLRAVHAVCGFWRWSHGGLQRSVLQTKTLEYTSPPVKLPQAWPQARVADEFTESGGDFA